MTGNGSRSSFYYIQYLVILVLLVSPLYGAAWQASQMVTGTGTVMDYPGLTITFPPAGGAVTGKAVFPGDAGNGICAVTTTITMTGTFNGGDGGDASGTMDMVVEGDSSCHSGVNSVAGTWEGKFFANGEGSGTMFIAYIPIGPGLHDVVYDWKVNYPPEAFSAGMPAGVTAESIYNNYGILVEDSFGDDEWEKKSWSDQELTALDEVLRELPADLRKMLKVTRFVRNSVMIDSKGQSLPSVTGAYYPCVKKIDPGCDGSSATIRIFDEATLPYDFSNDPDGIKEFKGVILHELTHSLVSYKDKDSIYKNANASPMLQNFMDATRLDTTLSAPVMRNGWGFDNNLQKWKLFGAENNQPPTVYGNTSPGEDLAESLMLYVIEPEKLKGSSTKRYEFIRDQVFGGVEYDNGHSK